jgi:hypothetical protein
MELSYPRWCVQPRRWLARVLVALSPLGRERPCEHHFADKQAMALIRAHAARTGAVASFRCDKCGEMFS